MEAQGRKRYVSQSIVLPAPDMESKRLQMAPGPSTSAPATSSAESGKAPASIFGMPTGSLSDRFAMSGAVLGTGQFGTVSECTDRLTGERMACKTIGKEGADVETRAKELRNEVAMMMRLQGHSNLVQLRGVFEEDSSVHLVMDLCEGGDLFDEVVRRERFAEADAARLFAEIVKSVAFCHNRGVLHRDLKPENLLLTQPLPERSSVANAASSGVPLVKLVDFGLALELGQGQQVKGMAGSPFYMAPEVLTGEYGFKADVWSLGVILYILLNGCPPFWGEKDEDVFRAILEGKPDLASAPWTEISAEAKSLVKCLLEQDPACRPSARKVLSHPWIVRHVAPRGAWVQASTPQWSQVSVPVA